MRRNRPSSYRVLSGNEFDPAHWGEFVFGPEQGRIQIEILVDEALHQVQLNSKAHSTAGYQ